MPNAAKRVLVVASTFPADAADSVPAFVHDQVVAMHKAQPDIHFSVLAPHDNRSATRAFSRRQAFNEYRFHYAWPFRFERLAGRGGIMPQLKANPLYYGLVPCLFIGEFIALLRLTRRLKPDYIYAHWFTPQGITSAWVARLTDTPFVFTTHAADVDVWHKIPLLGPWLVRAHVRPARAVTAVSRRSRDKLASFFATDDWKTISTKTAVIPMGVPLAAPAGQPSTNLRTRYDLSDEAVILFTGRLAEKKGIAYLLEAMTQLSSTRATLIIAGDGPLRAQLEKQAAQLGLKDQVRFVGYVSGQTKADYLALADVVAVPSIITSSGDAGGLPVVLMEALAAGKVCVATAESGADDIITDGQDGFLVAQKDATGLAARLVKALTLPDQDRQALVKAAARTAEQFSWPHIAARHLDFFDQHLRG